MKKKLLLIPIAIMSCFITGCEYDTYFVPLYQWADQNGKTFAEPYFKVMHPEEEKTGGYRDYDNYVGKAIKGKVSNAEEVSKNFKKDIQTDSYLSYNLNCHIQRMEYCTIRIYENGYITTYANAEIDIISSFLGRPKDQKATYKIEEEKAKEIIEIATNRYLEIKETIEREQAELEEAAQIENVLDTFEQSEETLNIWYNYRDPSVLYNASFPDTDRELLADLKALDYEKADDYFVFERIRIQEVVYRIKDLRIVIYNHVLSDQDENYDLISTRIRDNGKYPQNDCLDVYYKIDPQKGKELVQKVAQLYLDYSSNTTYSGSSHN